MEAQQSAVKVPVSIAVCPVNFTEQPPKKRTSFMVDDIFRDPNSFNTPCSARCFPDSSYSPESTTAQANEAMNLSKHGEYFDFIFVVIQS